MTQPRIIVGGDYTVEDIHTSAFIGLTFHSQPKIDHYLVSWPDAKKVLIENEKNSTVRYFEGTHRFNEKSSIKLDPKFVTRSIPQPPEESIKPDVS